jgi:dipeptidyl aminopeptidase/acylaminoacyl peptidase
LTHNEGEVVDVLASEDGRQLFFETRLSQRQIEARLAEEARSGFLYNSRFYPTYSTQPLLPEVDGADAFTLWVYDFASRRERLATQEEQQEYQLVSARGPMSPAGAEARTEPFGEGGARHVTVRRPGAASAIVCAHPDCYAHDRRLGAQQLRGMWWRSEDELIFARGDRSTTTVYAWRVGAETVPRRILTTLDMVAPVAAYWKCSIGGDRLICFHEQANYPRRLVAIDLDSGSFQTLYDPNPNFARFDLGPPPQYLTIDVDSEVRTFGYLVLPPHRREGERLPLVIVTYRCNGFLRGGVGDEYPVFPFAAQGFAVLCYDIPTEDPLRLAQMGVEEFYNWSRGPGDPIKHRIQDGLNSAVEQLDSVGIIDPNRVGLTGLSYGGETAIFALFNMNHLATAIASGVEIGPSSTFLYSSGWERTARAWGLDRWDSPRWDTLSVTHNVDRVYAPLLLNIPDRELISALHPYVALQQGGRPVEMYVFPDEYHAKWQPAHRLAIYQRNIDWMNFWLRDVEDPDPAKATQYERWRALRAQRAALR